MWVENSLVHFESAGLQVVDVDRLFTNMETVCEVSAALLHRLHEAMADPDPEAVVIGNASLVSE